VCSGQPKVVCIEGSPGMGKTALVHAFLDRAGNAVVLRASGDEDEASHPWGVLDQLARSPLPAPVAELRALSQHPPGADPLAAGSKLLEALGVLQAGRPVLIVIDDVHWADEPSARVLRFAARRLQSDNVMVLVTARSSHPDGPTSAWRRLAGERGRHLHLSGLGVDDLVALGEAIDGARLSHRATRRLWEHTEGHPLHARSLLEELDPEALEAFPGPLPAPRSFAGLVLSRLAGCSESAETLVTSAAVLGRRSRLSHALSLAGVDDPVAALSEAVDAGLLSEVGTGPGRGVTFSHPLVHAAVYGDLSPARRRSVPLDPRPPTRPRPWMPCPARAVDPVWPWGTSVTPPTTPRASSRPWPGEARA